MAGGYRSGNWWAGHEVVGLKIQSKSTQHAQATCYSITERERERLLSFHIQYHIIRLKSGVWIQLSGTGICFICNVAVGISLMLTVCIVGSLFPCCFQRAPCISGCQPLLSPWVLMFALGMGKLKGELQQANSVQDMSMPYLVVSLKRVSAQI